MNGGRALARASRSWLWPAPGRRSRARPAAAPRRGPNVLLVTIDTLRADHVGAYGYGAARDAVARRPGPRGRALGDAVVAGAADAALARVASSPAATPEHGIRDNARRRSKTGTPTLATSSRGRLRHRRLRRRLPVLAALRPRPRVRHLRRPRWRRRPRGSGSCERRAARGGGRRACAGCAAARRALLRLGPPLRPARALRAAGRRTARASRALRRRGRLRGRAARPAAGACAKPAWSAHAGGGSADHGEGLGDHGERPTACCSTTRRCASRSCSPAPACRKDAW